MSRGSGSTSASTPCGRTPKISSKPRGSASDNDLKAWSEAFGFSATSQLLLRQFVHLVRSKPELLLQHYQRSRCPKARHAKNRAGRSSVTLPTHPDGLFHADARSHRGWNH